MPIVYSPTFQHEEWIDNVDRVQAAGSNGFNIRFNTIEAEFHSISQIVQLIDTALGSLGQQVAAPVTIGQTPAMLPFGANPTWSPISWSRTSGGQVLGTFVEKPAAQDQAWGVLSLDLPNGVHLTQIKVLGEQVGTGDVVTELRQEARTDPFARTTLVTVNGLAVAATAPTPIPGAPVFDGAANLYYLLVRVQNATTGAPPAGSTIRFRGCQITYQP
jgi:hypothetical protein